MSRILVTGGAGFIGSHVVDKLLSDGDEVVVVDNLSYAANLDNLSFANNAVNYLGLHKVDIAHCEVINIVEHYRPDVLINLAAETHVDNSIVDCRPFVHSNISGIVSILEACKKTNTPLCHISTDEVYGPAYTKAFTETDQLSPKNPYAATKAAAEHMIKAYANTFGIMYQILRPSNNYGPRQHKEKFLPKLINSINKNNKFPLYGDGNQKREWLYVKDSALFITHLAKSNRWNEIINIGCGQMMKNTEMIHLVNYIMGNKKQLNDIVEFVQDRQGHDKCYQIDTNYLKSIIEYKTTSLNDGLVETISYYNENLL